MSSVADATIPQSLSKARIEALTDGIFAIAMTLLVLNISVPVVKNFQDLPPKLFALWPKYLSYIVSFVMLGIYWVGHHNQFHLIRRSDRTLLWSNLLFLMTISFFPFSTALLGTDPTQQTAVVIYGVHMTVIGLLLYWHWWYAVHDRRLVERDLDPKVVLLASRRILIGPAVFSLAVVVSFFTTKVTLAIYLLSPVI